MGKLGFGTRRSLLATPDHIGSKKNRFVSTPCSFSQRRCTANGVPRPVRIDRVFFSFLTGRDRPSQKFNGTRRDGMGRESVLRNFDGTRHCPSKTRRRPVTSGGPATHLKINDGIKIIIWSLVFIRLWLTQNDKVYIKVCKHLRKSPKAD